MLVEIFVAEEKKTIRPPIAVCMESLSFRAGARV